MSESEKIYTANGEIAARDNFVLSFFGRRPFAEMVQGARAVFEHWLEMVPGDALRWALVGGNSVKYRRYTPQVLAKCLEALTGDAASKADVFIKVAGPEAFGADYRATVMGYKAPRKVGFADQTNLLELMFPRQFCDAFGSERFVEFAAWAFETLAADSGYAAPALTHGIEGDYDGVEAFIPPRALQHHGLDVANNRGTAVMMGGLCRGARWLTMLSPALLQQAGGMAAVQAKLAPGVHVHQLAHGVLLRAGQHPEIGAVNHGERTPLLASVARAIENISYFGDNSILPLFGKDADQRDRWERRFWWSEG